MGRGRHAFAITDQDWYPYVRGRFRVQLSKPRKAYETFTTQAHFAGLWRFPNTGTIALMVNTAVDEVGSDGGQIVVSHDNGQTFGAPYTIQGSHTSAECMTWVAANNRFEGAPFAPADYTFGSGGTDRRVVTATKRALYNDGAAYNPNIGTVTFQGMPTDIGNYGIYPGFSAFGRILQLASNNWITVMPITTVAGGNRCDSFCFKSTDGGPVWNYLSSLPIGPGEGMDEGTILLLADGRIMYVSRVGAGPNRMCFSSDLGATWSALTQPSTSGVAAYSIALSGTPDYAILTGAFSTASVWPAGPDPVTWLVPNGYVPVMSGLYLSDNPDVAGWPVVDLVVHHNLTAGASLRLGTAFPRGSDGQYNSGYQTGVDLLNAPAGSTHLLLSYDRSNLNYVAQGCQVFVVDAFIDRIS